MPGYPVGFEERLEQAGKILWIRPIRTEDLQLELDFVHDLSPDTAYLRFFSPMHELTPQMAERFTHVDYQRSMAFIALEEPDAPAAMVGVARYMAPLQSKSCEFAVTIADRWQHRGLGSVLMKRLIAYARQQGFETMEGSVLQSNPAMRSLASKLGFAAHSDPQDMATLTMRLVLQPPASAQRS
jgi:acetyltransferase